jgi:hypothetical protein
MSEKGESRDFGDLRIYKHSEGAVFFTPVGDATAHLTLEQTRDVVAWLQSNG